MPLSGLRFCLPFKFFIEIVRCSVYQNKSSLINPLLLWGPVKKQVFNNTS